MPLEYRSLLEASSSVDQQLAPSLAGKLTGSLCDTHVLPSPKEVPLTHGHYACNVQEPAYLIAVR